MQGIFINGSRPKSKKQVREMVEEINNGTGDAYSLIFEATSMIGNEYDGSLASMPEDTVVHFVGPDPYRSRKFYGTVEWDPNKQDPDGHERGRWIVR